MSAVKGPIDISQALNPNEANSNQSGLETTIHWGGRWKYCIGQLHAQIAYVMQFQIGWVEDSEKG